MEKERWTGRKERGGRRGRAGGRSLQLHPELCPREEHPGRGEVGAGLPPLRPCCPPRPPWALHTPIWPVWGEIVGSVGLCAPVSWIQLGSGSGGLGRRAVRRSHSPHWLVFHSTSFHCWGASPGTPRMCHCMAPSAICIFFPKGEVLLCKIPRYLIALPNGD